MPNAPEDKSFDEILHNLGPDATATFDNGPSNPTEFASSEATNAATAVEGEDEANEDLEDEDDDAAIDEEEDEESEGEDVEDEANL